MWVLLSSRVALAVTELAELVRDAIWARVLLSAVAKVSGSAALKKPPLLLTAACHRSSTFLASES
ncbi:hypothetical protein D3C79_722930 [compost metagenome]